MNNIDLNSLIQSNAFHKNRINLGHFQVNDLSALSLQQTNINSRECPHCGSHMVISYGNYKGRKRYLCKNCKKTYNDLTKTPFSGIHDQKKILTYLDCMIIGFSIRKAAEIVNISILTSFKWRHKILRTLDKLPSPKMKNVKEMMEMKIPYSHKGQRTKISDSQKRSKLSAIFVCDRTGKMDSDSIEWSKRTNNPILKRISDISDIHTDIILPTNLINIINFSNANIKTSNSTYSQTTIITQIIALWEKWMKRFHGVASKYFTHYLHWFDFLDNSLFSSKQKQDLLLLMLKH